MGESPCRFESYLWHMYYKKKMTLSSIGIDFDPKEMIEILQANGYEVRHEHISQYCSADTRKNWYEQKYFVYKDNVLLEDFYPWGIHDDYGMVKNVFDMVGQDALKNMMKDFLMNRSKYLKRFNLKEQTKDK